MPLTRLRSPAAAGRWLKSWVTGTLRTDSRAVQPGDGFIAWPGHVTDGRRFVSAALDAGAATCLVEETDVAPFEFDDARVATLKSMKKMTGPLAAAFFDEPSHALCVIAATGTNGKTSTAWWMSQCLNLLHQRAGFIGTLGIGVPALPPPLAEEGARVDLCGADWTIKPTGLTTPDPVLLQSTFKRMVDADFRACAIEASSIGIVEQRLAGTRIEVALLTNFTQDHLDYHGSMEHYWAAKRQLFNWVGLKAAVVNIDDEAGAALAAELRRGQLDVWTYSTRADSGARLIAEDIGYVAEGLAFTLVEDVAIGGRARREPVATSLVGDYNVGNLLAVIGGLRAMGVLLADAARTAGRVTAVPGRLQRVTLGVGTAAREPEVLVDYAHTPDALEKVLGTLRSLSALRGGKLYCVFGCGGERDTTKRALMGEVAARLADQVIITSDNPRGEDPQVIVDQIAAGALNQPVVRVVDRRAAIARAFSLATARDIVLLAGKGHEDYQEIGGQRLPFSDFDEASAALAQWRRLQ